MDREPVKSSNLASVGYDPDLEILEIEFKDNRIYQYRDVPRRLYDRLMKVNERGESVGKYHSQYIEDGYDFKQIE